MHRRIPRRSSVDASALPPLSVRHGAPTAPSDPELARSTSRLRMAAKHFQSNAKPLKPTVSTDVARHVLVQLAPLPPSHRSNNHREEREEDQVLATIWRVAATAAKQQSESRVTETRPNNNELERPRRATQFPLEADASGGGTTLARYRRLVGMHARKTLSRILSDAAQSVIQWRCGDKAARKIQHVGRRFLGRRRRERMLYEHVTAVERLQCAWRATVARRLLNQLRCEARTKQRRATHAVEKLQRHYRRCRASAERTRRRETRACDTIRRAVCSWWRRRTTKRAELKLENVDTPSRTELLLPLVAVETESLEIPRYARIDDRMEEIQATLRQNDDPSKSTWVHDLATTMLSDAGHETSVRSSAEAAVENDLSKHPNPWNESEQCLVDRRPFENESENEMANDSLAPMRRHENQHNQDSASFNALPFDAPVPLSALVSTPATETNGVFRPLLSCNADLDRNSLDRTKVETPLPPDLVDLTHEAPVKSPMTTTRRIVHLAQRYALRVVGRFFVCRCLPLARTRLLIQHAAATRLQCYVRQHLARQHVAFCRQLHITSLRSQLQMRWKQSEATLLASLFGPDESNEAASLHTEDAVDDDDDLAFDSDDETSDAACAGPSWADVLPTRNGSIPFGLVVDLARGGPASVRAPSLGLWTWSWTAEQWQPKRELFHRIKGVSQE